MLIRSYTLFDLWRFFNFIEFERVNPVSVLNDFLDGDIGFRKLLSGVKRCGKSFDGRNIRTSIAVSALFRQNRVFE